MRSRLLPALTVGAALWVVLVSAVAAALSALGWWSPWLGWPVAVAVGVAAGWCVRGIPPVRMPVAASVALVAVVAGFTVWAGATHSEQVLPRRDAASNLQAAVSLATTHARVVAVDPESVGGSSVLDLPGVTLASPAFFEVGSSSDPAVQPQFVVGPAVVFAFGWWAGGAGLALAAAGGGDGAGPARAGTARRAGAGRLAGRGHGGADRHPVPGAAHGAGDVLRAAGDAHPHGRAAGRHPRRGGRPGRRRAGRRGAVGRAGCRRPDAVGPVSAGPGAAEVEPADGRAGFVGDASSQGMVVGRAPLRSLVLHDASARAGLLAGLLVGGTGLVRVDALREVVLLLPVLALGAAFGARWPRPVLLGLGVSLLVSAVAAVGLSWQYLASIAGSLVPLLALGVLIGGGSWVVLALWRRGWRLPSVVGRWLPNVAAGLVVVVGLYLAGRPLWQVVRQDPNDPGSRYVAGMQARQGLPVDGGRTYAEQTVAWLSWYVGPVALVVALAVLAALVRRAVLSAQSRRVDAWLPALLVASGSTLLTLVRPGITPDHPWADRRLLIALPLVVALVMTGLSWVVRRTRAADRAWVGVVAAGVVAASLVVPALVATWPHRAGGVERGSLAAVQSVCDALSPGDVVMAVDSRAANEWPQVVRGTCGVPALSTTSGLRSDPTKLASTVATVSQEVGSRGGRLVLLAADSSQALDRLGAAPASVADTTVREDEHVLEQRPSRTDPLPIRVWLAAAP